MLKTHDDVMRFKQATIYDILTRLLGIEVNEKTEKLVEKRPAMTNNLEALATGNTQDAYVSSPLFEEISKEMLE